ncbi:MAG: carboxy terminal-processing peptidase [Deltaproteobacteria bacterium]|nr:carboxy terminal-processing peptidase [Deltaproteobacteria bacterium]
MNYTNKYRISPVLYILILCMFTIGFLSPSLSLKAHAKDISLSLPADSSLGIDDSIEMLPPTRKQSKINIDIVKQLEKYHYKDLEIDDHLSSKMFDRYLSDLDGRRSYFFSEDIKEFEAYRYGLDDALKIGDLKPAFIIFNRYRQRVAERLVFLANRIEKGFDDLNFDIEESISIDRESVPWPINTTEMDDLWRKRLKNDILNLKLTGKPLDEIHKLLKQRYRNRLSRIRQTDSEDVFRIYMNAFTQIYDPHTQYFSPRLSENFDIMMSLSLQGIGAVLQNKNEYTQVLRLVPSGPADKSGQLKPGDRIVGVGQGKNGEIVNVIGWRLDDVVELIRGPKQTVVRLEIIPSDIDGDHPTQKIMITRNTVKLEEQAAQKKLLELGYKDQPHKIGIIDIPTFYVDFKALQAGEKNYKSTTRDVRRLLKELIAEKVEGIIIDLRDNGGGALQEANALTGLFINKGPTVQIRENNGQISELRDPDPEIVYDGPLIVLVNRLSASASEIFAGAVQDYQRGIIVGSQTFGKGTVQSLEGLRQGQLKLTRAKFYRVSGKSTQSQGIIPDIVYPTIYDIKKIGENALPEALSWDKIHPARYQPWPNLVLWIKLLESLHKSRIKDDPDFSYLVSDIERLNKARQKTAVSLKEAIRKREHQISEQRLLDLENKRRAIRGLKLLKKISDLETMDNTEENEKKPDPLLAESQYILLDLISMAHQKGSVQY